MKSVTCCAGSSARVQSSRRRPRIRREPREMLLITKVAPLLMRTVSLAASQSKATAASSTARIVPHRGARPRRADGLLRHAGHRARGLFAAKYRAAALLEGKMDHVRIPGLECRPHGHDRGHAVPDRRDAGARKLPAWLLVHTQPGVLSAAAG